MIIFKKTLNLPEADIKIRQNDGRYELFDVIRKKYVTVTPEEWVRQRFIQYLILRGFSKNLISVESGLVFNKLKKRSDILIYSREGKPYLLVECKSFDVAISQASFEQVITYNKTLNAEFMVLTNGLKHFCCSFKNGSYEFLNEIPLPK